jgi:streptogramin lyase
VVGSAADVYSLGCVLYEALTGIVPYARAEADTEPEIPEGLEAVIRRAVAKDAADRYPTAGALIAAARARQGSEVRPTAVLSGDASERTTVPAAAGHLGIAGRRAALWIAGGLAMIVASVALALVLLLNGGGPEVSAPVRIGAPPLHVAAGPKAAWVTSTPDGTLTRLNPNTGERVGRPIDLGGPGSGVAVGSRWIWVTVPRRGEVLRVDSRTGKVADPIEVGGAPAAIALTKQPNLVWVADEDGRGVAVIDAETGAVRRPHLPPHTAPLRLAAGAGGVWTSIATTGRIRRIDPASLTVGAAKLIGRGPAGITVGHGFVWVANARAGEVTKYDPSHNTVEPIEVGGRPGGIDAGTNTIWVANRADDTVTRIDIASAEVEGDPIAVGPDPSAVAVGGDAVWVANNGDGTVTRIEP